MNHETTEQAALGYLQKFERTDAYSPRHMEKAFIAGASWREQQAASGFECYAKAHFSVPERFKLAREEHSKTWQASALHSAKLLAEKDEEIAKLRKERLELLEYKFMYEQLCK